MPKPRRRRGSAPKRRLNVLAAQVSSCRGSVGACGRIDFDPLAPIDGTATDAATDAAPLGAFSTPTMIAELADPAEDDDPTLTADLLELYFASARTGGLGGSDIWRATRASVGDSWTMPRPVVEINSAGSDENPGVSSDGLSLWFSSTRNGGFDIWLSTRTDRAAAWTPPALVIELSSAVNDTGPEPSASSLRMILDRGPAAGRTLFESTRSSPGAAWNSPVALTSLNTATDQKSAFFVNDLEIWFVRSATGAQGERDLYSATRADVTSGFGNIALIPNVNSATVDDDPWLSQDGRLLVFASERADNREIWQATR